MPSDWERLATYGSMVGADLACARLEQAGIEARSATDDAGGAYPVMQSHGCRVLVRPADLERAQAVLDEVTELASVVESSETLAAAEDEVATRGGGRRLLFGAPADVVLLCIAMGFFLGFLAARGGLFTSDFVISWTGETLAEDLNVDGRPDEWAHYFGNDVVRVEQDRNFDGKVDLRWHYQDGRTTSSESDDDFDGRMDTWGDFIPSGLRSAERDADRDGVPDGTVHYENGVIARESFSPGRGRIEREDLYENGILREIHLIDASGERRTLVRFDALGRVVEGAR